MGSSPGARLLDARPFHKQPLPDMIKPVTRDRVRQLGQVVLGRLELAVIFAALITIPLTVVEVNGQNGGAFQVADWAIWTLFLTEYLLGLALADDRRGYVLGAWLGLAVRRLISSLARPICHRQIGSSRETAPPCSTY